MNGWQTRLDAGVWRRSSVGGKGFHLAELARWGFRVPRFGVVTTDAFARWEASGELPRELLEALERDLQAWGAGSYAVRSSMTLEDGDTSSFAGVLETFLFVPPDEVAQNVVRCFESLNSDRAREYLARAGLKRAPVAVVVQEMVAPASAGVAFSRAPSFNSGLVYVEAGLGVGEGVVSGQVEVDSFWLDRFGNEWKRVVREKLSRMVLDPERRRVQLVRRKDGRSDAPALTPKQVAEIAAATVKIEERLGRPADVEWAVDESGQVHILQARAITQPLEPLNLYADTNLCESYPGVVSPLTSDFVRRAYTLVMTDGMAIAGVPRRTRERLAPALKTLVRDLGGHLYYNLNSYYTMLASLPGGKANIRAWHQVIGGSPNRSGFERFTPPWWASLWSHARLLWIILFHKKIFERFCRESSEVLDRLERSLEVSDGSREAAGVIPRLFEQIRGLGLPVINDFLVMVGMRAMGAVLQRNEIPEDRVAYLLRTRRGVESMGALDRLRALAKNLARREGFRELVQECLAEAPPSSELEGIFDLLRKRGFATEAGRLQDYLADYGDRSFEELKLECMTYRQSPRQFFEMLLWEMSAGAPPIVPERTGESQMLARGFPGVGFVDRLKLRLLMRFCEATIRARESTRLMRGRFYGVARRSVLAMAKHLKTEEPELFEDLPLRDFFSLDLSMLEEFHEGRASPESLAAEIRASRGWQEERRVYPEFVAHCDVDPRPYFLQSAEGEVRIGEGALQGVGASKGTARGPALLLTDPRDALKVPDLSRHILVTHSTDPAWIFIMSRCAGLVSEKGSLLSHTAIVGREMRIPTVVGVKDAMRLLRTGEIIEIDGEAGTLRRVKESARITVV